MERESQLYAHKITHDFLKAALAGSNHQTQPQTKHSAKTWVRNRNIIGCYFGSPASKTELAERYQISRERIRQIIKKGVSCLWQNCSAQTQQLYPLVEIPLNKPESQRSKEKRSLALGGTSFKIALALKDGKTLAEIQKDYSFF